MGAYLHTIPVTVLFCVAAFGCTPEVDDGAPASSIEDFGTVRIEMSPLNADSSVFEGTVEVTSTVHYQDCLVGFYTERQPSYAQDGIYGEDTFTYWRASLCNDFTDIPDCAVTSITQTLSEPDGIYSLSVTYEIDDPATIAYRQLHVGPLPVESFAGCDPDVRPLVILGQDGLIGRNAGGDEIWRISTLPGQSEAFTNQGAPLRVELSAN